MEQSANLPPPPTPSTPSFPPNTNNNTSPFPPHNGPQQQQQQQQQQQPPNSALLAKLAQMRLTLAPLVQLTTGEIHPSFPSTLLNFWLLTDAELEALASFYHQRTPCEWTHRYPCPVRWGEELTIEAKRRKIGRFIGLRGCESPVVARLLGGEEEERRREERIEEEARRRRLEEGSKHWYYD